MSAGDRRLRQIPRRLTAAGALTADRATSLGDLSRLDRGRLRRYLENNVVHEAAPERYWLDADRYALHLAHQRRLAILGILAVLVILFFVVEIAGRS